MCVLNGKKEKKDFFLRDQQKLQQSINHYDNKCINFQKHI